MTDRMDLKNKWHLLQPADGLIEWKKYRLSINRLAGQTEMTKKIISPKIQALHQQVSWANRNDQENNFPFSQTLFKCLWKQMHKQHWKHSIFFHKPFNWSGQFTIKQKSKHGIYHTCSQNNIHAAMNLILVGRQSTNFKSMQQKATHISL